METYFSDVVWHDKIIFPWMKYFINMLRTDLMKHYFLFARYAFICINLLTYNYNQLFDIVFVNQ